MEIPEKLIKKAFGADPNAEALVRIGSIMLKAQKAGLAAISNPEQRKALVDEIESVIHERNDKVGTQTSSG